MTARDIIERTDWPVWLVVFVAAIGSWLFIAAVAAVVMTVTGAC